MEEESRALQEMKGFLLKFYDWENKSITFGHFITLEEHLSMHSLEKLNIDVAKRPTGGGVIFHFDDLSFSLLIPKKSPLFRENTLESYAVVNEVIGKALKEVFNEAAVLFEKKGKISSFCMASPTIYDLMLFGKKIGGAAQRRSREGVLHQTSLQLLCPEESVLRALLKKPEGLLEEIKKNSFSVEKQEVPSLKERLKKALVNQFSMNLIEGNN